MRTKLTKEHPDNMGERIRKQRELMGYTREDLAEKIDVSVKFIADIELGNRKCSIETLIKLSETLNISTDYILLGKISDSKYFEEEMIEYLVRKCPKKNLPDLVEIIRIFIRSVERR